MIEEFLHVLVDRQPVKHAESVVLDAPVHTALAELEPAFDYGLYGLQAYAVVFSRWPMMSRTYERLWTLAEAWSGDESEAFTAFRERLQSKVRFLRTKTLLATEEWRVSRERVYADMYAQCASGLGTPSSSAILSERIAPIWAAHHADAADQLRALLQRRFCRTVASDSPELESLVAVLIDYFRREQAVVRAASEIQRRVNCLLRRPSPVWPLKTSDLHIYYELQELARRQPYLIDDLKDTLGLRVVVTQDTIELEA
jgi:hypothetical protein